MSAYPSRNGVRRRSFLAAALATATLGPISQLRARPLTRPRITILLIVEQFRTDYLFRNLPVFAAGGFRRLMDESSFFPDCRLLSSTFTSSGIATLGTGCYPNLHGIVADHWYEPTGREVVSAHPDRLEATTLFDGETDPKNRFFGIAATPDRVDLLKPTGSAASFSRLPDGTFSYHGPGSFSWLAGFNEAHAWEKQRNRSWVAQGAPPGTPPLRSLTYDPAHPQNFNKLLAGSPFGQSTQMDLLNELVGRESLGENGFDTAVVVLDSLARLGLEVGAVSPLIDDEVIALDAEIATLFESMEARGVPFQVIFTAAHGAPVLPPATSRVPGQDIVTTIEEALEQEFGKGQPGARFVEAYIYPFLYLRAGRLNRADLPRAREAAGKAALQSGLAGSFYTLDGVCSHAGDWEIRLQNSFHRSRSGDLLLVYQPGFVEDLGADRGISYGSPYNYDARVPLFFWGTPFVPSRFDHMVELTDISPTLAAVAGLPLPSSATGRVLVEAFGERSETP